MQYFHILLLLRLGLRYVLSFLLIKEETEAFGASTIFHMQLISGEAEIQIS